MTSDSKICFITNAYPDYEGHYRGNFVKNLALSLMEKNFSIFIVTPRVYKNKKINKKPSSGEKIYRFPYLSGNKLLIEYEKIPYFRMVTYFISGFFSCIYAIKKEKSVLIHAHWVIPTGLLAVLVNLFFRLPVIIHVRGSDIHTFGRKNSFLSFLSRFTLKKAVLIVTPSQKLKKLLMENFRVPQDKIKVIINGIDTKRFSPGDSPEESKEKLGLPVNKRIILFVGGIVKIKGLDYMVSAAQKIVKTHKDLLFVLVGKGEYQNKLYDDIEKKGLIPFFLLAGEKSTGEIPLWLNAAHIFLLPSLNEGMPNSVLEALSCKVPVVASNVGDIPLYVKNGINGFLVSPENSEDIADKLALLLDDENVYNKIKGNSSLITHDFDSKTKSKEIAEIYRKLIKEQLRVRN
ncbi:MAG: glycosyltransferase [Thermodesulfobacteriota bacterium]|nr:glycosyltransferase [Thermodesulfobacteriota bacterium]